MIDFKNIDEATLQEKINNGEIIEEVLFEGDQVMSNSTSSFELSKNINKFKSFKLINYISSAGSSIEGKSMRYSVDLSNTSFSLTFNNEITHEISLGEGEGDFSDAEFTHVAQVFQNKIDAAFGTGLIKATIIDLGSRYIVSFCPFDTTVDSILSVHSGKNNDMLELIGMQDGASCLTKSETVETYLDRDYINKWVVETSVATVTGSFGDGKHFYTEGYYMKEGVNYIFDSRIYKIIGYRPTRKTIYIYKSDPNTYLYSSLDELLYTSDDYKLATADLPPQD